MKTFANRSVLAGLMIMIGCGLNLTFSGVLGAFLFSIGLISVVSYKLTLFTGKAGLLVSKQISAKDLIICLIFNFIGVAFGALLFMPYNDKIATAARGVITLRLQQGVIINCLKGIGCGILVSCGVAKKERGSTILTSLSVISFILLGFNHCIADFGYSLIALEPVDIFLRYVEIGLIPTIVGNIIGGCLFHYLARPD